LATLARTTPPDAFTIADASPLLRLALQGRALRQGCQVQVRFRLARAPRATRPSTRRPVFFDPPSGGLSEIPSGLRCARACRARRASLRADARLNRDGVRARLRASVRAPERRRRASRARVRGDSGAAIGRGNVPLSSLCSQHAQKSSFHSFTTSVSRDDDDRRTAPLTSPSPPPTLLSSERLLLRPGPPS
jgi:hypothetical protein